MKVLDLFSGIGGFSLGLERAGMETVAFCEIEEYPKKVLAKHWPNVPIYEDVRNVTRKRLETDGIRPDAVCGGFPCQPHSFSGERKASEDNRDMWPEVFRVISENRPKWAVLENVRGILSSENGQFFRGILRDLASIGYNVEWFDLPGGIFGAEHIRPRVWMVAYPHETQFKGRRISERIQQKYSNTSHPRWGKDKSGVDRMANGIPSQMDRLGCLGNAVIPEIPELIGSVLMDIENEKS